jgi:hypothetical protein
MHLDKKMNWSPLLIKLTQFFDLNICVKKTPLSKLENKMAHAVTHLSRKCDTRLKVAISTPDVNMILPGPLWPCGEPSL